MKTFVTGASGHLGANLVRRLIGDGVDVRVLLRQASNNRALDGLPVEKVYGDLRDRASLERALGHDTARIFHCAAQLSTIDGQEHNLYANNIVGTRNLLGAARQAGVGRVVVTGSFSAVGHRHDRPSDESEPFNPFDRAMPYEKSKAGVEHECLKAVVEGQDVVIATSCAILGPNDFKPSRMGQVLIDFSRGKMRAYIPGGFEFVAARDIVAGHLLVMEKGRTGQKYICSTRFVSVDELMDIMARVTGHKKPALRLPGAVMAGISQVTTRVLKVVAPHAQQRLTPGAVHILRMERHADISKAKNELGYQPTSIEDAVREAYDWFIAQGEIVARPGHQPLVAPTTRHRSSADTAQTADAASP